MAPTYYAFVSLFQTYDGSVQLLVNNPPDFEKRDQYTIDIIARDNFFGRGGAVPLESKAVVCRGIQLSCYAS